MRTEAVERFVAVLVTVATDAAAGATGAAEAVEAPTVAIPPERPIARMPVAARRAGAADMNVMGVVSREALTRHDLSDSETWMSPARGDSDSVVTGSRPQASPQGLRDRYRSRARKAGCTAPATHTCLCEEDRFAVAGLSVAIGGEDQGFRAE